MPGRRGIRPSRVAPHYCSPVPPRVIKLPLLTEKQGEGRGIITLTGGPMNLKPRGVNGDTFTLADDHHAIARLARHDRERRRQVTRINTLRARADAHVETLECAL
jgi:hypothetical protein